MPRFLKIMLAMLALVAMLAAPAFATPASTSTDLQGQPLVNLLGDLQAKVVGLRADVARIKRAPKPVVDLTGIEARLGALEQELSTLKIEVGTKASNTDLGTLAITVDELKDALTALDERVNALEETPAVVNNPVVERTTEVVFQSNSSHPAFLAIPSLIVAEPLPGQSSGVGFRMDFAGRFLWDIPKAEGKWVAGVQIEGGPSMGGFSARGGPEAIYVGDGLFKNLGVLALVGYNCAGLQPEGCSSEETGPMFATTWERQVFGPLSLGARAGVEINHVTATGALPGTVARGVFGLQIGIGSSLRPEMITVE